jgi:PTH1 family peptidyl-tRNA hydrolase
MLEQTNINKKMYLIVGLGNPENEYSGTRHNMGFDTINKICTKYNIKIAKSKFNGLFEKCSIEGEEVILLKPQTYMNLSGTCVREFANFYKIPASNILVIYDDMDIDAGSIKVRKKGNSGSHNGMKSIVENLGTIEFPRIRIGIGRPMENEDKIKYVIGKMSNKTKEELEEGTARACEAVGEILKKGIDTAMNKFN